MPTEKRVKYILVTGGVISGVGKDIISSSLGVLLKNNGYKVSAIKIDPYLNEDAGTFSPYEHGEVFVLDDGGEVDLDLGNYERFLDIRLTRDNNITTGKMFKHVMERERRGDYCGKTVQMIPHLTDAIVDWVERVAQIPVDGTDEKPDVCIIELGGTIGDIEGMTYLSAFERFQRPTLKNHLMNVHVSLILHPNATGEPKTKPMQNSVRHLRAAGLVPDLLICRSTEELDPHLREKIVRFVMMDLEQVVGVYDVSHIYKVPLLLQQQGVLEAITHRLGLTEITEDVKKVLKFTMNHWTNLSEFCDTFKQVVNIAPVGKYVQIADVYAPVNHAHSHAAIHAKRKLKIHYVDAEQLENKPGQEEKSEAAWKTVKAADGVIVPGGFDKRGTEGMINAAEYCRKKNIPSGNNRLLRPFLFSLILFLLVDPAECDENEKNESVDGVGIQSIIHTNKTLILVVCAVVLGLDLQLAAFVIGIYWYYYCVPTVDDGDLVFDLMGQQQPGQGATIASVDASNAVAVAGNGTAASDGIHDEGQIEVDAENATVRFRAA